jgi:hypothetical protein
VRIADFTQSVSLDDLQQLSLRTRDRLNSGLLSLDWQYLAPEAYEKNWTPKSYVFSFALILYEVLVGKSGISRESTSLRLMKDIVFNRFRPTIPNFILRNVRQLIIDCWAQNPDERPSFDSILDRLQQMNFEIAPKVNSLRVREFVNAILSHECSMGTETKMTP